MNEKRIHIVYFSCEIGGFFEGYSKIEIYKEEELWHAAYLPGAGVPLKEKHITLSIEQYEAFMSQVFETGFLKWNKTYNDPDILDGTQWMVTVRWEDGQEISWDGSNAYPPKWRKFMKAVNSIQELPDIR